MTEGASDQPAPVHPGEILTEEFLKPYGLTPYGVARRMNIPRTRVERLARCEAPVSVDTAARLGRLFGTTPDFWLAMQMRFDLRTAATELASAIDQIEPLAPIAA